ncbi:MAG: formylglycine-generating enzyme family protein [Planctomycetes bacterium]|nr:formylglycine-generating enzyme family protein [Planctomycetota bacterium]
MHLSSTIEVLPAIEENRPRIEERWPKFQKRLTVLSQSIEEHRWPAECGGLTIGTAGKGPVVFRKDSGLANFEPIEPNLAPLVRSRPQARDFRNQPAFAVVVPGKANLVWPKYIRPRPPGDPNVILRFVPQGSDSFYMALREITNEQYRTFLARTGTEPNSVIIDARFVVHPYRSEIMRLWTRSSSGRNASKSDHPVVWVTLPGAQRYAEWLGASLPTTTQCWHATQFADPTRAHYTDPNAYHVRAKAWIELAKGFNPGGGSADRKAPGYVRIKDPTKVPFPPAGVDDPKRDTQGPAYGPEELKDASEEPGRYKVPWPTACYDAPRIARGNLTGVPDICDLIGNVWEWCASGECYGGSCLSSLNDLRNESGPVLSPTELSACDLGFRIVVRPAAPPR